MRAFLRAAALTLALTTTVFVTTPAFPQQPQYDGVDAFGHGIKAKPDGPPPIPRNEGAYRDALKRIPDQSQKVDPWGNVREKPASSK
jgi:hypothetical protein